jgi:hypothetical protein
MRVQLCAAASLLAVVGAQTLAIDIECRIVEQLGADHEDYAVLKANRIVVRPGSSHRLRIQFMATAAPGEQLDGFVGWNVRTIHASGGLNSRTARPPDRVPRGRIPPFTAAAWFNGAEGLPSEDPFTSLDSIDCTLGQVTLYYQCRPNGTIPPDPYPPARGVDAFVSIYEITTTAENADYSITCAGHALAALYWTTNGCNPPVCGDPLDPNDDELGFCYYAPWVDDPQLFSYTLQIIVCPAEWNDDRSVNSQDFFDFLDALFAGVADFNTDGVTNSQDFFDYLGAFFAGC